MLPAILGVDVFSFGKINDKVHYKLFKEPKLLKKTGNEWFFEIKNKAGMIIAVEADTSIFKMYRVK
jgi:hypothetical protein